MITKINPRMLGYQSIIEESTFGTGISDSFPIRGEFNIKNLLEIKEQQENYFKVGNISADFMLEIIDDLKENNFESSVDNIALYLQGYLDYTKTILLDEYLQWYSEDQEN